MELCLGENNPQAHYIQGMHDYFHNNNTKKRLDHLRRSADVMCDNGTYLYGLLMSPGATWMNS
ncbi:hypothetical protein Bca4012_025852 [Brassica carinata]|uniref:At2g35280-like TPR domain-containing protein n=1 Tax=Brassica carinata TaxID=52824 RepID=A0A8X8AV89_BRACI|nr:hypothetical protein Bca52824_023089 [Brassica carinata]